MTTYGALKNTLSVIRELAVSYLDGEKTLDSASARDVLRQIEMSANEAIASNPPRNCDLYENSKTAVDESPYSGGNPEFAYGVNNMAWWLLKEAAYGASAEGSETENENAKEETQKA